MVSPSCSSAGLRAPGREALAEAKLGHIRTIESNGSTSRLGTVFCMHQGIGNMHRGERTKALIRAGGWAMIEGQGFDNRIRQAPEPQQIGPYLGVCGPQQGTLGFPYRGAVCLRLHAGSPVEIRQVCCEDQRANVVQQAGHKGMIDHLPVLLLFLGNTLGTGTRGQAVLPEDIDSKSALLLAVEV